MTFGQWQPIETAPKDGTPVLLWDRCARCSVVAHNHGKDWFVHDSYGFNEDGWIPDDDVTHWMPIPEAPQ